MSRLEILGMDKQAAVKSYKARQKTRTFPQGIMVKVRGTEACLRLALVNLDRVGLKDFARGEEM